MPSSGPPANEVRGLLAAPATRECGYDKPDLSGAARSPAIDRREPPVSAASTKSEFAVEPVGAKSAPHGDSIVFGPRMAARHKTLPARRRLSPLPAIGDRQAEESRRHDKRHRERDRELALCDKFTHKVKRSQRHG